MDCTSYCRKLHKRDSDIYGIKKCMVNCNRKTRGYTYKFVNKDSVTEEVKDHFKDTGPYILTFDYEKMKLIESTMDSYGKIKFIQKLKDIPWEEGSTIDMNLMTLYNEMTLYDDMFYHPDEESPITYLKVRKWIGRDQVGDPVFLRAYIARILNPLGGTGKKRRFKRTRSKHKKRHSKKLIRG
jgi:hypothetical protein